MASDEYAGFATPEADPADAYAADTQIDLVGRCADFCACDGPTQAATESLHGRWCRSRPCGREVTAATDAGPAALTVELVRPYRHGSYPRTTVVAVDTVSVQVTVDAAAIDDRVPPLVVRLGSAAARQLAATLVRAADQADGLDEWLRDEWRARESRRHQPA